MSQINRILDWVLFAYITILNLVFLMVAWIFWIWRDGLLTPEETTAIMMEPLIVIGPLAFVLDLVFGLLVVRFLRRRAKGDSSISANN